MYFYAEGDLFDPLWVPAGDWGKNHSLCYDVPADKMPSRQALYTVADFAARGYRAILRCPCGWQGEMTLSPHLNTRSPLDLVWREACGRCGGEGLELAELVPPADIEGLPLDLGADIWDGLDEEAGMAFDGDAGDIIEPDPGWPEAAWTPPGEFYETDQASHV